MLAVLDPEALLALDDPTSREAVTSTYRSGPIRTGPCGRRYTTWP
jgi:hypothetical protein